MVPMETLFVCANRELSSQLLSHFLYSPAVDSYHYYSYFDVVHHNITDSTRHNVQYLLFMYYKILAMSVDPFEKHAGDAVLKMKGCIPATGA